jgi:hypothetical protein
MANSPIQVVLNPNVFIDDVIKNGGGQHKDFFASNDQEFREHKAQLQNKLFSIKRQENAYSDVTFAKVIMRSTAIAKSHRPSQQLFTPKIAPIVGAGSIGELFVELSSSSIDIISNKIEKAEDETRWKVDKEDENKRKPNPSKLRSEVGAIVDIIPYSAEDKRKFSTRDALEWFVNPLTTGTYIIQLFEGLPPRRNWDLYTKEKREMISSFVQGLEAFGKSLRYTFLDGNNLLLGIKLISAEDYKLKFPAIDLNPELHETFLRFLDEHPLVRKISLPPIITKSAKRHKEEKPNKMFEVPKPDNGRSYPKICIVDGGVAGVLGHWIEDTWHLLSPEDRDEDHGTFIAGLSVFGNSLNGHLICNESDGCTVVDLGILPRDGQFGIYFNNPLEMFDELNIAVQELKEKTGVRVFNFSLNYDEHVSSEGYSYAAQKLDQIAEENDVVFIISAGNTEPRKEWPADSVAALRILAVRQNDMIKRPAESCRNISVSALNPPHIDGIVPYALSSYSCRGPALRFGVKPDMAHVGGYGGKHEEHGTGLLSIDPSSQIVDGCGTSYAAPHVAKTMACIDHAIEGEVSRETLLAMGFHHSVIPDVFKNRNIVNIAKHLVGFGMPQGSEEILNGDDHSITLVFASRAFPQKKLSFDFNWPTGLIKNDKIFGYAKLTIVSTPPFDYGYGAEFVRINVDAHLTQLDKDGNYKSKLKSVFLPEVEKENQHEKNLIENSFKWSPVKIYDRHFSRGISGSSSWRMEVKALARDGESIPRDGIPFTVILTISDPKKEAPIFNEVRQTLQALNVETLDIRTATRVLPRV